MTLVPPIFLVDQIRKVVATLLNLDHGLLFISSPILNMICLLVHLVVCLVTEFSQNIYIYI